jgi:hypothetical protein
VKMVVVLLCFLSTIKLMARYVNGDVNSISTLEMIQVL